MSAAAASGHEAHLTGAVVMAIAQQPGQTSAIIKEAVRLEPQKSSMIVARASHAFPGLAEKISAAAGVKRPANSQRSSNQSTPSSWWWRDWAITVYVGRLTTNDTSEIFLEGNYDFQDSGLVVAALSKEFVWLFGRRLSVTGEAQIGRHFGGPDHWEFNGALMLRWHDFPWNDTIITTLAFGAGGSYATEMPALEEEARGPENAAQDMTLVAGEITFALPSTTRTSFVLRYHHRSDVTDADSTVFGLGLKYRF